MLRAAESPYLVPFDGSFRVEDAPTEPPTDRPKKKVLREMLDTQTTRFAELQRRLYADDRSSVLLVFQAMDAAGKDSTIRAVLSGVNPAGFQVFSFKKPSSRELDHDFLWRSARALPERGRIGVFNRSYYEEVLVVRVHPEFLAAQKLPYRPDPEELWAQRFDSIRDHEAHLARNGTVILKFWLNVSKDEQRDRFVDRLQEPKKNWKFEAKDVAERAFWDRYMHAYQEALAATSRPWAPWYAIPADHKPFMRWAVSDIIVRTLDGLDLRYPPLDADELQDRERLKRELGAE